MYFDSKQILSVNEVNACFLILLLVERRVPSPAHRVSCTFFSALRCEQVPEATEQRDFFLTAVRAPGLATPQQRRDEVIGEEHAFGVCLSRRRASEDGQAAMPACGCTFHGTCLAALAQRARYGMGRSDVSVGCLYGSENTLRHTERQF